MKGPAAGFVASSEDDLPRCVQSVGDSYSGENGSECSPGSGHFGLGEPQGAGTKNPGREAVKRERDVPAGVSIKTAGNVPERSAQQQTENDLRSRNCPQEQR